MNGYVVAGYVVVLSVLAAYTAWLLLKKERPLLGRSRPRDRL